MRRTRWRTILCGLLLLVTVPGCGGCFGREKGKNSDLDRPKAQPEKPPEKK